MSSRLTLRPLTASCEMRNSAEMVGALWSAESRAFGAAHVSCSECALTLRLHRQRTHAAAQRRQLARVDLADVPVQLPRRRVERVAALRRRQRAVGHRARQRQPHAHLLQLQMHLLIARARQQTRVNDHFAHVLFGPDGEVDAAARLADRYAVLDVDRDRHRAARGDAVSESRLTYTTTTNLLLPMW